MKTATWNKLLHGSQVAEELLPLVLHIKQASSDLLNEGLAARDNKAKAV